MSYDECPNCGGAVVGPDEDDEVLCTEGDCLWWENVETGVGYDGH